MNTLRLKLFASVLTLGTLAAGMCVSPANALTWDFSYSGSGVTASGVLTTSDLTGGVYDITGISVTRNGVTGTTLLPAAPEFFPDGQTSDYFTSDNILNASAPFLNFGGFLYQTSDLKYYNVYYEGGVYYELSDSILIEDNGADLGTPITFAISEVSSTPLPTTLPLFAGGLGFVGYLTRRRKHAVAAA
jgi:hypothetical protein